ncbi:unnamed protein product [Aphanomyces euteiches]|uniref:Uncharacterized protein n=1 Tax=Aphanomyces euteiches TaxID=100861 RepID=A0A6G0XX14_9STRA|nr:hypothetical protein Ae201684_000692 [Aphanomyces euteiches]KAH9157145.1 hypothetical protein AeRB84_001018 [Aphanomyces euteiches]
MASEKTSLAYWAQGVRSLGSLVKDKTTATVRKVSGTTIPVEAEHRNGESFLRTTTDIRDKVNRGDILTFPNGDSFAVSTSPHDMFTATVITLKTTTGNDPGVNEKETCKMTSLLHNTPMNLPKVSVPTSMGDVYMAAESVGKGIVGIVGLGVQKASDLAASAKSYEESVRVYEAPIGTLVEEANKGASELRLTESTLTGALEEVLCGLEEIPDCLVSVKKDSSYAETTSSLTDILRRGDHIMIDGEAYKVSINLTKRFTATQLPLDRPRARESVDATPIYKATHSEVCIRVPNCTVSLAKGSTELVFTTSVPAALHDASVVIGGERFQLDSSGTSTTQPRRGASVSGVAVFVPQTPVPLDDCQVTLQPGEAQIETSKSLLAFVSRGDFVKIGSETFHISQNPIKRLTATSLPLDRVTSITEVFEGTIAVYQNGARKLKAGDTIKLGTSTYTIAESHDGENNSVLPVVPKVQQSLPAGTAVFYVGNRYVKATEKAAAVAHRAGAYKAPVGKFLCLVQGSNVLFTDGDMRKYLKKGDEISIAGQTFIVSPDPKDLYARDCLALDRRYEGPSLRNTDCEICHVTAFERGSTDCFVDADTTEKLQAGDRLNICGEDYTITTVTPKCIAVITARSKESVYQEHTIVPDCLVSLAEGSKYAETSSNITNRIKRGDRIVIGGEIFRVSANMFNRFTADHLPLDSERVGPSVEHDDLRIAAYDGDRTIRTLSIDFNIYKHGDRMADLKDEVSKRDILTKTQQTTEAIGEKLRPGAEKVAATAAMATEKIKDAASVAYAKAFGASVLNG